MPVRFRGAFVDGGDGSCNRNRSFRRIRKQDKTEGEIFGEDNQGKSVGKNPGDPFYSPAGDRDAGVRDL